ncbi:sulfite exporter TauE/SafE family protein [Aliamphritea ceti]|uniref:sulfite exporter TauE/SafE family protein n=1 Tax=Aliamphritea ceti TaxID=1524258 RepID=UPI0021C3B89C|nr:sulfite exporter TauE/SafE family protein [Aliamphritea ceti]
MLLLFLGYLVLGAFAGVLAGLFGVGGGLVIVPVLVVSFQLQGMAPEVLTHVAVATSLATIVVTSISSISAHHKRGAVRWRLFRFIGLGVAFGSALGVVTAIELEGKVIQLAIGVFALYVAIMMGLDVVPKGGSRPSRPGLVVSGGFIGWVSAIFGIGGGTLTVPYLNWKQVNMQEAVATSAACGFPIAVAGAVTNALMGQGNSNLGEWSLGYIYLPALLGISLTSYGFAKFGAKLAHSMSPTMLRRAFSVFLLLVAGKFILSNI